MEDRFAPGTFVATEEIRTVPGSHRRIVYSALIGDYEKSIPQPAAALTSTEFVCFTDNPELVDTSWNAIKVEPRFPTDLVRSARFLKAVGHPYLDSYDEVLWIDNRVQLKKPPDEAFNWLGEGYSVAAPRHSFRDHWKSEFAALLRYGYDDPARVRAQYSAYAKMVDLNSHPYWTGILARRWTPFVHQLNSSWWENILLYSRRDQLSFPYVYHSALPMVKQVELNNVESGLHRWIPVEEISRDLGRSQSARGWNRHSAIQAWDLFRASVVGRKLSAGLTAIGHEPFAIGRD